MAANQAKTALPGTDRRPGTGRRPRGVPTLSCWVAVLCLLGASSCADPEPGSPAAAYQAVVAARTGNDGAALYALLSEDLQERLQQTYDLLERAVALADEVYPPGRREEARAAAGAALLERVDGPEALFQELSAGRTATELSALQRLGSAPASTTVDGDRARVRTRGGDVWQFRKASDGSWRWVPPEADREVVDRAYERAKANVEALRKARTRIESLRSEGIVRALAADVEDGPAADDAGAAPAPEDGDTAADGGDSDDDDGGGEAAQP